MPIYLDSVPLKAQAHRELKVEAFGRMVQQVCPHSVCVSGVTDASVLFITAQDYRL